MYVDKNKDNNKNNSHKQSEELGGNYMGIENRSQMTSHCNGITRKPPSLSVAERDRELSNSSL